MMAVFKFRLAPVHELRKHAEKESRDALAAERRKLAELENEGASLESALSRWSRRYTESAKAGVSPSEAGRILSYIDELNRMIEENVRAQQAQSAAAEKARFELVERMKDRKTLDSLRDRQFQAFIESERHKEEKELEELINGRIAAAG